MSKQMLIKGLQDFEGTPMDWAFYIMSLGNEDGSLDQLKNMVRNITINMVQHLYHKIKQRDTATGILIDKVYIHKHEDNGSLNLNTDFLTDFYNNTELVFELTMYPSSNKYKIKMPIFLEGSRENIYKYVDQDDLFYWIKEYLSSYFVIDVLQYQNVFWCKHCETFYKHKSHMSLCKSKNTNTIIKEIEKIQRFDFIEEDGKEYVYLLKAKYSPHWKIGHTKNPDNRLKTFNVKLPFQVEYDTVIPTSDMRTLEKLLHDRFTDKRINGEWFDLDQGDVEYIRSLAK